MSLSWPPIPAESTCAASTTPVQLGAVLAALHRGAEQVWPSLQGLWERSNNAHRNQMPHLSIEVLPEAASTNATLMQRVRSPQAEPCLLVAAHQSAGRGRMGKVWASAPGESLTCSLALPLAPASWSGLSLAVGVSIADALTTLLAASAASNASLTLKWPNDLWLAGEKLAGILIETAHLHTSTGTMPWVVIGVGINVQAPTLAAWAAMPPAAATTLPSVPPTGLRSHGWHGDVGAVLAAVAPALLADVLLFEAHGFAPFQSRFARRDALWQQPLCLSDGRHGIGMGVDAQGVLQVQTPAGVCAIHSAEVSVRPLSQPPVPNPASTLSPSPPPSPLPPPSEGKRC